MSILVKLTKIQSNHNNLRTDVVEGYIGREPRTGECLYLVGEPLTTGAAGRLIHTTNIQTINQMNENKISFKTLNSTYELEYLKS